jgi:hypothetical protein
MCCSDRLNSPPIADIRRMGSPLCAQLGNGFDTIVRKCDATHMLICYHCASGLGLKIEATGKSLYQLTIG